MNFAFTMCIGGILLNALGITFDFFLLNVIGSIAMIAGSFKIKIEGTFSKKIKIFSIISVPFALISFGLSVLYRTSDIDRTILYVALGIVLFFYIYYTFYFTENLISHARGVNELAATRSFQGTWSLNAIIGFVYFFCYNSTNSIFLNIGRFIFLLSAIYYCFTIYSNSKVFFLKK